MHNEEDEFAFVPAEVLSSSYKHVFPSYGSLSDIMANLQRVDVFMLGALMHYLYHGFHVYERLFDVGNPRSLELSYKERIDRYLLMDHIRELEDSASEEEPENKSADIESSTRPSGRPLNEETEEV